MRKPVEWKQKRRSFILNSKFVWSLKGIHSQRSYAILTKKIYRDGVLLLSKRFYPTSLPDTIENKKYKNNWKTVFPHRVKACWDKMIAWPLILKGVFSMYSIQEMKTSSHINIYIPVLGSYNCHRTIYDVQAISFLPTDLWGFKMVPFKGLCSPNNINWNFPGLVVIWLF